MKDYVEVFFHTQQPYTHITEEDLEKYDSGRLGFPNSYFDPEKAHTLYNQYHEQYALADEIRGWLDSQGVSVEDSASGSAWESRPTS